MHTARIFHFERSILVHDTLDWWDHFSFAFPGAKDDPKSIDIALIDCGHVYIHGRKAAASRVVSAIAAIAMIMTRRTRAEAEGRFCETRENDAAVI